MPKTRLTSSSRNVLSRLVASIVECPVENKAEQQAYDKLAPAVRAIIEERFPLADMAVLKRYDVGGHCADVYLNLSPGGVESFRFKEGNGDKSLPYHPTRMCNTVFAANAAVTKLFTTWARAREVHYKALETKRADYFALIQAARNYEDVLDVWPEAEQVRTKIGAGHLIVAVDDAVVQRIRADVASRKKAA